jgi:WD40 repeat protein
MTTWDARTGQRLATVEVPTGINSLTGGTRTELFAVTDLSGEGDGGTTRVFDAEGTERAALHAPGRELIRAAIDPDGRRVAVTSTSAERLMKTRVDVWDIGREQIVQLVTGALDRGVAVWDVADGDIALRLLSGTGTPGAATFSSDGSRIATTTFDGSVRIWDAASGSDLGAVQVNGPIVIDAVFSPDGTRLVTTDETGAVRQWLLELDDLLALADERVTRELTDEECRQYLHSETCEGP